MLILKVNLHLKKPPVTTLTETREFTSRNYEVKKGLKVPDSSKNTITLVALLRFALE